MKSIVGIYQTHQDAVEAVSQLSRAGYETDEVSLLGKADMVDNHITIRQTHGPEMVEMSIGVVTGTVLGVLTGVGILALPGLGFLFGAGALVGAFVGFDLGIVGGGFVAMLTSLGMTSTLAARYEQNLMEGKFLVFVQGTDEELDQAQVILHDSGLHMELDRN